MLSQEVTRAIHIMFEDDPNAQEDSVGKYYNLETITIVDKDVGMDLRPPREFKSYRERNNKSHPDDVFKMLLSNTLKTSESKASSY
jgi:hypothetical protein